MSLSTRSGAVTGPLPDVAKGLADCRHERDASDCRALLAVNNIEVIYNHVILVLKGGRSQVPAGGIVALLGANGAGKTTTLKAISNLLRAERGEVTKGSINYSTAADRRARRRRCRPARASFRSWRAAIASPT